MRVKIKSIDIEGKNALWSSNRHNNFTKYNIKLTIRHITKDCYFTVGNSVFIQIIGIPMWIDPSFWANLTSTDLNVASCKIF